MSLIVERRLRQPTHRGSVIAHGFFWRELAGDDARPRVLASWQSGAVVRRVPEGYVMLLREPLRVMGELGRAAPLVQEQHWLTSAPLSPQELPALREGGDLLLVVEGRLHCFHREQLAGVEPSNWLDVGEFTLLPTQPLGRAAPLPTALTALPAPEAAFDAQTGRRARDRQGQQELLEALTRVREGAATPPASELGGVVPAVVGWLRALAQVFRRGKPPARDSTSHDLARLQRPPFWERIKSAFATWLARTRLMQLVGRKHAEYLRQLLDMLAAHDDDEVLRRAIPLNQHPRSGEESAPALLPPAPRSDLTISLRRPGPRPSVGLVTDLFASLRRSYEAVFKRLDEAGRHADAAYFLAEILGEVERAVAYLERHGQVVLAAKLAESRELSPGIVVRQWFIAGDRERAVTIAARENAFDDAVLRLERAGQKAEAQALRLLHAERLASAGRLVRAAELAYPVPEGRALALRWLELARGAGELRGVPLELALEAARFELARAALRPLLEELNEDQVPLASKLCLAFVDKGATAGRPLAQQLCRGLIAYAASEGDEAAANAAWKTASWVGGAFKADHPSIVGFERRLPATGRSYTFTASDGGRRAAFDAIRHGSSWLVALGEAGVSLLNQSSVRVAHFDVPATALVAANDGSRVLTVTPRGDGWLQVGRIDLATRRCEPFCEIQAASFARTFDGETWHVCTSAWPHEQGELLRLDVLGAAPTLLARWPMPLEGPSIQLDERWCNVVGAEPFSSLERLRYELPSMVLRQRNVILPPPPAIKQPPDGKQRVFLGAVAAADDGPPVIYDLWLEDGALAEPTLRVGERNLTLPQHDTDVRGPASLIASPRSYALTLASEAQTRILIGSILGAAPHLDIRLEGTPSASVRLHADTAIIADSAGRLLSFDLVTGRLRSDLRL
jgi:hypothetical protein